MPGPSVMSLETMRAGRRVAPGRMVLYLSSRAVARAIQTMPRPGPKSTTANRRVRALLAGLCALYCALPLSSWAGRPGRGYEVDVDGQSGPAGQGLPISLLPLAVVDSDGNLLAAPAMLQSAQRYGGDEILVGRADGAAPDSDLQWTLYSRSANESWNGPLAAGIDHTVDLLVPQPGASLAQAEVETRVRIEGGRGLVDYAAIARLLQSVPGVRRANIAAAAANSVALDVTVRGGAAGLDQALAGSTRLVRASTAGGAPPARLPTPR